MLHYVCALPNKKGTAAPLEFISDDPAKIEEWARRHDARAGASTTATTR